MQQYGIPGCMVDIPQNTSFAALSIDPAPKILKQVITRTESKTIIEYESRFVIDSSKTLTLPSFERHKYKKFLFYCHAPEHASDIHKENYNCFLKDILPELQKDLEFFTCILHNVDSSFGFTWLAPNVIIVRRNNQGLDFGAFTDGLHFTGLDTATNDDDDDRFIVFFMNDTVYGPTIPWWVKPKPQWTSIFKSMLTNDVKLAGMTINVWYGEPHVQSMLMVTDNIGLRIGMQAKIFARRLDKVDIIHTSEIGFSTAILKSGYNIDCAAELLHGHDFRIKQCIPLKWNDITFDGRYDGFSIHPFETIFSKTNRMNRELSRKLMHHVPSVAENTTFYVACDCIRHSQRCQKCKSSPLVDNTNMYFDPTQSGFMGTSDYTTFNLQDDSLIMVQKSAKNKQIVHVVCSSSKITMLPLKAQLKLLKKNVRCIVLFTTDMSHMVPFMRLDAK